jgi:hypothetical protein
VDRADEHRPRPVILDDRQIGDQQHRVQLRREREPEERGDQVIRRLALSSA